MSLLPKYFSTEKPGTAPAHPKPHGVKTGVLLLNLGTPQSPQAKHVRPFLAEFLSDRRVIEMSRAAWYPILGMILAARPKRSGKLYQNIWTEAGSPLLLQSQEVATKLEAALNADLEDESGRIPVRAAMTYGQPSVKKVIDELKAEGVEKLIVLPLYPQYAAASSGAALDQVWRYLLRSRYPLAVHSVHHYETFEPYLDALEQQIHDYWQEHGRSQKLLISFHGIPCAQDEAGDPYRGHCEATFEALKTRLVKNHQANPDDVLMCYQSKFGPAPWLTPSTQDFFASLPAEGVKSIDVICPGFLTECLETLEEIQITGTHQFQSAGGEVLHYIPALGANETWVKHGLAPLVLG
ncbi:ferrochelatase [Boudabousia liubingyangii]|uniref:ferrochelatase n=1 Tax=Boudabousia liubingyangii TaxID=1921764 RepID=UPI001178022D|nr:ferrochelatase [Boudabousia liubingyangii]